MRQPAKIRFIAGFANGITNRVEVSWRQVNIMSTAGSPQADVIFRVNSDP